VLRSLFEKLERSAEPEISIRNANFTHALAKSLASLISGSRINVLHMSNVLFANEELETICESVSNSDFIFDFDISFHSLHQPSNADLMFSYITSRKYSSLFKLGWQCIDQTNQITQCKALNSLFSPSISQLDLSSCSLTKPELLGNILRESHFLMELNLSYLRLEDPEFFSTIFQALESSCVETLILCELLSFVPESSLPSMERYLSVTKHLKTFRFGGNLLRDDEDLIIAIGNGLKSNSSITEIDCISNISFSSEHLEGILLMKQLEALQLTKVSIDSLGAFKDSLMIGSFHLKSVDLTIPTWHEEHEATVISLLEEMKTNPSLISFRACGIESGFCSTGERILRALTGNTSLLYFSMDVDFCEVSLRDQAFAALLEVIRQNTALIYILFEHFDSQVFKDKEEEFKQALETNHSLQELNICCGMKFNDDIFLKRNKREFRLQKKVGLISVLKMLSVSQIDKFIVKMIYKMAGCLSDS
jgi:hypothetical protein